jgi:hypothetical protein
MGLFQQLVGLVRQVMVPSDPFIQAHYDALSSIMLIALFCVVYYAFEMFRALLHGTLYIVRKLTHKSEGKQVS